MGLANDAETQARAKALEQGLANKGWIVGENLRIEYRFAASDAERMFNFSKELVALHPDIIIGHSTPVVAVLRPGYADNSDCIRRGRGSCRQWLRRK